MSDLINHPSHYSQAAVTVRFEPADLTERLPHPIASAVEYIIRAGRKEGVPETVDLKKARWWLLRARYRGLLLEKSISIDQFAAVLLWNFAVKRQNGILLRLAGGVRQQEITLSCIEETIEKINSRLEELEKPENE